MAEKKEKEKEKKETASVDVAAKGKKGKGKSEKKSKKKKEKTGPNKFLLMVGFAILTIVMLWVLGIIDVFGMINKDTPAPEEKEITNVEPTGSVPVTFAGITEDLSVYGSSPEAAKLAKIYSDMRPQKAADALSQMPVEEAVPIIAAMDEWRAGIIMSKMEAAKAVEISQLLAETYRKGESATAGAVGVLP